MKRIQNLLGLLMGMAALPAMAQTVNITVSSDRLHTITGFGAAAMSGPMAPINDVSVIDKLYGPDSEVGLNILRMEVSPNTIGDVTTPWDTPYDWHGFLPAVKRARQYGAIIFAAPWSPPASFKTNNSARGQLADGIIGKLRRDKYKDFFPWLNTFMRYMRNSGAPVDVVSIQNEPDWHPDYSGCYYTPQELDTLVREYGSRFDKSSGVKLMSGEALGYTPNYYAPTLNDPEARQYIDLLGGHTYGHAPFKYMKHAAAMAAPYGIGAWMTEHIVDPRADTDGDSQSDTKVRDLPTWHEQLLFAEDVNETMLAGGSAYVYWYMVSHYSFIGSGETTIQPGNTYGKVLDRGRIMGQFARHLVGATMLDRNSSINKEAQTFESSAFIKGDSLIVNAIDTLPRPLTLNLVLPYKAISGERITSTEGHIGITETLPVEAPTQRFSLPIPARSFSTFIFRIDRSATGISEPVCMPRMVDDAWYNLQGQRVARPQRGIYIHQGYQVVVR